MENRARKGWIVKIVLYTSAVLSIFSLILVTRNASGSPAREFWARLPLFSALIRQADHTAKQSKIIEINYYIPPDFKEKLLAILAVPNRPPADLTLLERYYARIIELFPNEAPDAHGLLGYFRYHRGETDAAKVLFAQASALNPDNFWHVYNLGVVTYEEDPAAARMIFRKAVLIPPRKSVRSNSSSRIYTQIIAVLPEANAYIQTSLKNAYANAASVVRDGHPASPLYVRLF